VRGARERLLSPQSAALARGKSPTRRRRCYTRRRSSLRYVFGSCGRQHAWWRPEGGRTARTAVLPVATLKMSDLPHCQTEYLCPLSLALANASDGFGVT
jgi:hypothetical protein